MIKFRAWIAARNEFASGVEVYHDGSWLYNYTEWNERLQQVVEVNSLPEKGDILEQYSGIKANNGTGEEIYVGDIVYLAGLGDTVIEFPFIELYEAMSEDDVGAIVGNIHEQKEVVI